MFLPLGFCQRSVSTSMGQMVYYTAEDSTWLMQAEAEKPTQPSSSASDTLVFLHGFGGGSSAYEWSKVYPAFAAEYRILAPDLIGWGRSYHPVRNYQIEDYLTT
ncbi:MAG TPA: alpha/beta fold hydrolase, partial [Candidatus Caenarcaniphilales bacterium]